MPTFTSIGQTVIRALLEALPDGFTVTAEDKGSLYSIRAEKSDGGWPQGEIEICVVDCKIRICAEVCGVTLNFRENHTWQDVGRIFGGALAWRANLQLEQDCVVVQFPVRAAGK